MTLIEILCILGALAGIIFGGRWGFSHSIWLVVPCMLGGGASGAVLGAAAFVPLLLLIHLLIVLGGGGPSRR